MTLIREKTNPRLTNLIMTLKAASRENGVQVWRDIASRLEGATNARAEVNVSKINRYAAEGETILVPGKLGEDSTLTFKKPAAEFYVLFDAGPGHVVEIDQADIPSQ